MSPDLLFYKLLLLALVWVCLIRHMLWPTERTALCSLPTTPPPRRKRSNEPKPIPASSINPCVACEQAADPLPKSPAPRRLCSPLCAAAR